MSGWSRAEEYVRLVLAIDHHLPGYVDAYFGPRELKRQDESVGKRSVPELAEIASDLASSLATDSTLENDRRAYLQGEIGAVGMVLRLLAGERLDIAEVTLGLYGLSPEWVSEAVFDAAHENLSSILPGTGNLHDRMQAFDDATLVPEDRLEMAMEALVQSFRRKADSTFQLPEGEVLEVRYVHDKPWLAFSWYLGNLASKIEFNLDLPYRPLDLPYLISHEAYPGHHTEHCMKDRRLVMQLGYLEHSIFPCLAPSALIVEGIAESAMDIILSPGELVECLRSILEMVGLPADQAPLHAGLRAAARPLADVTNNAILLLYRENASDKEVIDYIKRYRLWNDQRAQAALRFHKDPLWGSYGFTYVYGQRAVSAFVRQSNSPAVGFRRLLEEEIAPSALGRN